MKNPPLLENIYNIIEEKKNNKTFPTHALFYKDLLPGRDREELKQSLRELARQGKIHIGNTINDYYITLKEQEK